MAIADELKHLKQIKQFSSIILATGNSYHDALSGAYFAYQEEAPILLINKSKANDVINYIESNLTPEGKIFILGGPYAVSEDIENKLSKYQVDRIYGQSLYDTNLEILKRLDLNNHSEILVASGKNFYDAMSASSVPMPLMLVGDGLNKTQRDYLESLTTTDLKHMKIIGGPAIINEDTEAQLMAFGFIERIFGITLYDTSIAVAKRFYTGSDTALTATSALFYDGTVGGPLGMELKSPMLLTHDSNAGYAYNYILDNNITHLVCLGGNVAIKDNAVNFNLDPGFFYIGKYIYLLDSNKRISQNGHNIYDNDAGKVYSSNPGGPLIFVRNTKALKAIDVSQYNGIIDWKRVKKAGVDIAFIRAGIRSGYTGQIVSDTRTHENLVGAIRAGLRVGVYFHTNALSVEEAKEEAIFTLNTIRGYRITMPVVIDSEMSEHGIGHNNTSRETRTEVIKVFCDEIKKAGYSPMLYAG